MLKVYIFRAVQ